MVIVKYQSMRNSKMLSEASYKISALEIISNYENEIVLN